MLYPLESDVACRYTLPEGEHGSACITRWDLDGMACVHRGTCACLPLCMTFHGGEFIEVQQAEVMIAFGHIWSVAFLCLFV